MAELDAVDASLAEDEWGKTGPIRPREDTEKSDQVGATWF